MRALRRRLARCSTRCCPFARCGCLAAFSLAALSGPRLRARVDALWRPHLVGRWARRLLFVDSFKALYHNRLGGTPPPVGDCVRRGGALHGTLDLICCRRSWAAGHGVQHHARGGSRAPSRRRSGHREALSVVATKGSAASRRWFTTRGVGRGDTTVPPTDGRRFIARSEGPSAAGDGGQRRHEWDGRGDGERDHYGAAPR